MAVDGGAQTADRTEQLLVSVGGEQTVAARTGPALGERPERAALGERPAPAAAPNAQRVAEARRAQQAAAEARGGQLVAVVPGEVAGVAPAWLQAQVLPAYSVVFAPKRRRLSSPIPRRRMLRRGSQQCDV